uniref:Uncharacterized protein n=1 Tax=Panagrolaimus superbus TaxID=310955 RepID=A0A914XYN7_9BILA
MRKKCRLIFCEILKMKFYVFALLFFFAAIFAVNGVNIEETEAGKHGEKHEYFMGKQCWSTADCPRNQICLFPIPHHGEPGECT